MDSEQIYNMFRAIFYSVGLEKRKDVADALGLSETHTWRTLRGDTKGLACFEHVLAVVIKNDPDRRVECDLELLERVMVYHYCFDETDQEKIKNKFFPHFSKNNKSMSRKEAIELLDRHLQEYLKRIPRNERIKAEYDIYHAFKVLKQPEQASSEDTQNRG